MSSSATDAVVGGSMLAVLHSAGTCAYNETWLPKALDLTSMMWPRNQIGSPSSVIYANMHK